MLVFGIALSLISQGYPVKYLFLFGFIFFLGLRRFCARFSHIDIYLFHRTNLPVPPSSSLSVISFSMFLEFHLEKLHEFGTQLSDRASLALGDSLEVTVFQRIFALATMFDYFHADLTVR